MPEPTIKEIIQGCAWKKIALIKYKNKKGEVKTYRAEIYDVGEKSFYAFDLFEEKIKSFLWEGVQFVTTLDDFEPRFERTKFA